MSTSSRLPNVSTSHVWRLEFPSLACFLVELMEGLRNCLDIIELRRRKDDFEAVEQSNADAIDFALNNHVPTKY